MLVPTLLSHAHCSIDVTTQSTTTTTLAVAAAAAAAAKGNRATHSSAEQDEGLNHTTSQQCVPSST
jgi:hypothetical protein